jgi:hypothetical protein
MVRVLGLALASPPLARSQDRLFPIPGKQFRNQKFLSPRFYQNFTKNHKLLKKFAIHRFF